MITDPPISAVPAPDTKFDTPLDMPLETPDDTP